MTNLNKLKLIKEKIESLDKNELREVLKIVKKYNCKFTENNNGIFINMNKLPDSVIYEMESFLEFSNENNKMLNQRDSKIINNVI
tara:strand:+ start:877 stop:1131 length:255 start_codon:yes stop_codon:yes gene_type:complete